MTKVKIIALLGVVALAALLTACGKADPDAARKRMGLPPADFVADLVQGEVLYRDNCQACHGVQGRGSKQGPPLSHKGYRSSHHADLAFFQAVRDGVKQHHWNFGDMPAQPQISTEQAGHIVRYVRQLQWDAGIE
jgi:mono/diheme cytochrome c family protein